MTSDGELIARASHGDHEAFRALYRGNIDAVYRIAAILLPTTADAEDAAQETFVTAWRKLRGFRLEGASALPWFATICRLVCANRLRALRRERDHVGATLDERMPSPIDVEQAVIDSELADRVAREVARLDDLDRDLFVLCAAHGYAYEAAATELGLTHGAVRNRLSRIRSRLRGTVQEGNAS